MKKAILFLLLLSSSPAQAELSKVFEACMKNSGGVTVAMLDCIAAETANQDKRLNTAYQKLTQNVAPKRKEQLKAVEKLWIKFRDANCAFYADPQGGTAAGLASADCVLAMSAQRAGELEKLMPP